jgi:hypothetical protein
MNWTTALRSTCRLLDVLTQSTRPSIPVNFRSDRDRIIPSALPVKLDLFVPNRPEASVEFRWIELENAPSSVLEML